MASPSAFAPHLDRVVAPAELQMEPPVVHIAALDGPRLARAGHDRPSTDAKETPCCTCCFEKTLIGWPAYMVAHGALLAVLVYGGYTAWAWVNVINWNITCSAKTGLNSLHQTGQNESDGAFEYVLVGSILMVTTLVSACWVGCNIGIRHWCVTAVAVLTDVAVLGMFSWGIYLELNRRHDCNAVYAVNTPAHHIFFKVTIGMWVLHLVVVGVVISRWGHAQRYSGIRSLLRQERRVWDDKRRGVRRPERNSTSTPAVDIWRMAGLAPNPHYPDQQTVSVCRNSASDGANFDMPDGCAVAAPNVCSVKNAISSDADSEASSSSNSLDEDEPV